VFLEYWQRPDTTHSSFIDGWFRTGDIAIIENGYYRILGRQSIDIIKSGGYKLSALEIESVLLDHPDISQCAVLGVPDTKFGESVAVAVVLAPRSPLLKLESLKNWCKERMSHYKIPRKLVLVDNLPRNAMGKVTKPAVQKLFE
jgi:malonyl-CoA/methylmalonyl-CoA synthetase